MGTKQKIQAGIGAAVIGIALLAASLHGKTFAIFDTAGVVANQQRDLILFALLLSLVVVVPVFVLLIGIVWRYREHKQNTYKPDWDGSVVAETVWWGIPIVLIAVLGFVTWKSTHSLDPARPIASQQQALDIQVVALNWKWLFIYPNERVASVNFLQIPIDRPVHFTITSDAPMNSFWIPQLGSQIYAMAGMSTHLHLMAEKAGDYRGVSANISGEGFAGMHFTARATDAQSYESWLRNVKREHPAKLDASAYRKLAEPSSDNPITFFGSVQTGLYDQVIMQYMMPSATISNGGKP